MGGQGLKRGGAVQTGACGFLRCQCRSPLPPGACRVPLLLCVPLAASSPSQPRHLPCCRRTASASGALTSAPRCGAGDGSAGAASCSACLPSVSRHAPAWQLPKRALIVRHAWPARPPLQYRHLYKVREALPDVPFMALTATATPKVRPASRQPARCRCLQRRRSRARQPACSAARCLPGHAGCRPTLACLLGSLVPQVRDDIAANLRLKRDARK